MIEGIEAAVDIVTGQVWTEYIPAHCELDAYFLITAPPEIADIHGNLDDGYYAVLNFENGKAIYDLTPSGKPDLWDAVLRTWEGT